MKPFELDSGHGMLALDWVKKGKCICGSDIEFIAADLSGILVNAETKGRVCIDNFYIMSIPCRNPFCKWSKIKDEVDAHNYVNAKEAWKKLEQAEAKKGEQE